MKMLLIEITIIITSITNIIKIITKWLKVKKIFTIMVLKIT